jgi:hypothetical protein
MKRPCNRIGTHVECKIKVIQVKIVATGTISKSLRQYLSKITESIKLRKYKNKTYWSLHT